MRWRRSDAGQHGRTCGLTSSPGGPSSRGIVLIVVGVVYWSWGSIVMFVFGAFSLAVAAVFSWAMVAQPEAQSVRLERQRLAPRTEATANEHRPFSSCAPAEMPRHPGALALGLATVGMKWFGGSVDEVAIYPSVLSTARINAHYNAGLQVKDPGKVGCAVPPVA